MKKQTLLHLNKRNRASLLFPAFVFCSSIAGAALAQDKGELLFLNNCAECHQRDGKGIPNIYPALAGSEVVRGSAVDVALVMLIGRGEMPSFAGSITYEDMASIINYVRNSWGNSGEEISAQRIEKLR
ncbi:MAG: cytochrome c [Proteobacteria bacterium]|nr:cytochrome c [Pseudomonadota bacterium]MDA1289854.1 cytochrome c [Pseudomonadota bacterium]